MKGGPEMDGMRPETGGVAIDEAALAGKLLAWYAENGRDLPWRHTRDPYAILVSEVMLQQTRVPTVGKRYEEFLSRFPTIESLAAASEGEVLKAWEGLGYYRRALNLHKAARHVTERLGGSVPSERGALLAIPGIGEYTAAALGAICFGKSVAALDSNAFRVFSRVYGLRQPVDSAAFRSAVRERAERWLKSADSADFAQAVMDLSSLVCTRSPHCGACPLGEACEARRLGIQAELPARRAKAKRRTDQLTMLAFVRGEHIGLQLRPKGGILGGMYGFVCLDGHLGADEALAAAGSLDGGVGRIDAGPVWRHEFTHRIWDARGFVVRTSHGPEGLVWAAPRQVLEEYAIPSAFLPLARAALSAVGQC